MTVPRLITPEQCVAGKKLSQYQQIMQTNGVGA